MNTVVRTNNDFNFLVTSHSAVKSTERLLMPMPVSAGNIYELAVKTYLIIELDA